MPLHSFTSPTGEVYEINGPEGSTKQQAWEILQQGIAAGSIKPKSTTKPDPSFLDQIISSAKENLAGLGNTVDRGVSLAASVPARIFQGKDAQDEIFRNLQKREASRNEFANEGKVEAKLPAKLLAALPTLPAQIVTAGMSPVDTGVTALNAGESGGTTAALMGVDAAGQALGLRYGPMGKGIISKAITGGTVNAAQEAATRVLQEKIAQTEEGKRAFAPNADNIAMAGLLGAGFGAHQGVKDKRTSKGKTPQETVINKLLEPSLDVPEKVLRPDMPKDAGTGAFDAIRAQAGVEPYRAPGPMDNMVNTLLGKPPVVEPAFKTAPEDVPYVKNPAEASADNALVDRLQAAVDKQNPQQDVMRVTPEGQAFKNDPGVEAGRMAAEEHAAIVKQLITEQEAGFQRAPEQLAAIKAHLEDQAFWKQRAEQLHQEALAKEQPPEVLRAQMEDPFNPYPVVGDTASMEALARSQGDVLRNQVPEDGVIPRDSSKAGLAVPRGNDWVKDENGIPVRQGLPETTVDTSLSQTILGKLHEDKTARDYLGNAIQEANGPLLGPDQPYGSQSLTGPLSGDARIPFSSQRGAAPMLTDIAQGLVNLFKKVDVTKGLDSLERGANRLLGNNDPKVSFAQRIPGIANEVDRLVVRPTEAKALIAKAASESDGPALFNNLQSGLTLASEKMKSTMATNVAQWLQWSSNRSNYLIDKLVVPLETQLTKLRGDVEVLHTIMQTEMFNRKQFTREEMLAKGVSDKTIEAYTNLRKIQDSLLQEQNRARELLGKKPITPQEAYMSSIFRGDYHIPIYDKKGKLVWYVQTETRGQAKAAINWFKSEYATHPDVDVSKLKYNQETMYKPGGKFGAVPRDVMSSWADIFEAVGDTSLSREIKGAMEAWVDASSAKAYRQDLHQVDHKSNVRGFEGDQPWLTGKENSHNWAKAQIEYLKKAARWSAAQEAVMNAKEYLTNPDIIQNQPNNVSLTKAYVYNHMGLTENIAKRVESALAGKLGLSRAAIQTFTDLSRTGVYLGTLTANAGYMLATPWQAMHGSTLHYILESQKGNIKGDLPTFMKALWDAAPHPGEKLSSFNKEALEWASANGVISNVIHDYNQSIGAHRIAEKVQKVADATISIPDRFTRRLIFVPFANALWNSGNFTTKQDAFRRAGEITDHIAVSMRPDDKPLAVQKAGMVGDLAYVFHAPLANMYNQLSLATRHAANGNPTPLLGYLGAMYAVGGLFNMPGMKEAEGLWTLLREAFAKHLPEHYDKVDFDPKELAISLTPEKGIMGALGDINNYGLPSLVHGANLSSRFSNELLNAEDPLGSILPGASVYGNRIKALAQAAVSPNDLTGAQALKEMMPPGFIRGTVETQMDQFKTPLQPYSEDGITSFRNPNNLTDPSIHVNRTEEDINYRRIGLTSLNEAKRREKDILADKESKRLETAQKGMLDKTFNAILNGKATEDSIANGLIKFAQYGGDLKTLDSEFNKRLEKAMFDPQTRNLIHMDNYRTLQRVIRRMDMEAQ